MNSISIIYRIVGCILLLLAAFPLTARAQLTNIKYTTTTTGGQVTITGFSATGSGPLIIPATINSMPVVSIGYNAFYSNTNITSVTISSGIVSIGSEAFFQCYNLASVSIPDTVTSIDYQAFFSCIKLVSVNIPKGVTSIDSEAFILCSGLTTITVDPSNAAYSSSADGVLFNKNQTTLVQYPQGKAGAYTVPNTVKSIGDYAFGGAALTSVTIPDSVTAIGYQTFENCGHLASVSIGSGVSSIGYQAFSLCSAVTTYTVSSQNASFSSVGGVLFDKNQATLIQYPAGNAASSYTIPSSVSNIETQAFSLASNLTSVTIPTSVTTLGFGAFYLSTHLATVTIPSSITNFGEFVFQYSGLTSVAISSGITAIPAGTFEGTSLTSVTIPASVTNIESDAFDYCAKLAGATFLGDAPTMGERVFANTASGFTVSYQSGAIGFSSPTWTDSSGDTYPTIKIGAKSFSQWETKYPSLSDKQPDDSPEKDGVTTLFKYLYDIDPSRPMTAADRAALPVADLDNSFSPGTPYLVLTYRQNASESGITVNLQTSTDLKNWTTANPPDLTKRVGTDSGTGDPIIEVGVRTNGVPKFFIRLNVTMP